MDRFDPFAALFSLLSWTTYPKTGPATGQINQVGKSSLRYLSVSIHAETIEKLSKEGHRIFRGDFEGEAPELPSQQDFIF